MPRYRKRRRRHRRHRRAYPKQSNTTKELCNVRDHEIVVVAHRSLPEVIKFVVAVQLQD